MKNSEIKDVQTYMNEIEIVAKTLGCSIEKAEDLLVEYSELDVTALLHNGLHKIEAKKVNGSIYDGSFHEIMRLKNEIDNLH
jgi:hypothetical protein